MVLQTSRQSELSRPALCLSPHFPPVTERKRQRSLPDRAISTTSKEILLLLFFATVLGPKRRDLCWRRIIATSRVLRRRSCSQATDRYLGCLGATADALWLIITCTDSTPELRKPTAPEGFVLSFSFEQSVLLLVTAGETVCQRPLPSSPISLKKMGAPADLVCNHGLVIERAMIQTTRCSSTQR